MQVVQVVRGDQVVQVVRVALMVRGVEVVMRVQVRVMESDFRMSIKVGCPSHLSRFYPRF